MTDATPQRLEADVAVIGGGVIGLACAYELCSRGLRVVVLERERPGAGAGSVAAGMLAPISEADGEDAAFIDLALESCGLYQEWISAIEADAGLTCGYRVEGSLLVALHRDHELEYEHLARIQRRLGLEAQRLSRDETLAREPYLSPRVVGGLFVPGDRQVNPRRLTKALAVALEARGATIVAGATAAPLLEAGRAAGATAGDLEVRAGAVVIAGGSWSGDVWPPEAGPLPLRPVKGQIVRLRGDRLIDHVLRTPEVYLVPRDDGELVVGATTEEQGFDTTSTAGAVLDLLREAWRLLPGIAELELAEISAGLRPALRDHLPAIGATAVAGLFAALGHYRHGVLLAPVTAKLLADVIVGGGSPERLRPFDPRRLEKTTADVGHAR